MSWSSLRSDQLEVIARLEGKIKKLRQQSAPVTLYSIIAPTQDELLSEFSDTYPPAYSPALYETVQWVDPSTNTLKNRYIRMPDIGTSTTLSSSSGVLRPELTFPINPLYTKLAETYIDDSGAATPISINVTSTAFNNLILYFQIRDSANATSAVVSFRANGVAATNYGASYQSANSTFGLGTEQNSQSGWVLTAPAATSARTYYLQGVAKIFDYNNTLRMPRVEINATTLWGAPYTTSTTTNYNFFGVYNVLGGVTALSFVSATGFGPGCRLVLFGA